jgi:hypothetical protein
VIIASDTIVSDVSTLRRIAAPPCVLVFAAKPFGAQLASWS